MLYLAAILSALSFVILLRLAYHVDSAFMLSGVMNNFPQFLVFALAVCYIWRLLLPNALSNSSFRCTVLLCAFLPSSIICVDSLIYGDNITAVPVGSKVFSISALTIIMFTQFWWTPYLFFKNNQRYRRGRLRSRLTLSLTMLGIAGAFVALTLEALWGLPATAPVILVFLLFLTVLLFVDRANARAQETTRYSYFILLTFITIGTPNGFGAAFVSIFRSFNGGPIAQFLVFCGWGVIMALLYMLWKRIATIAVSSLSEARKPDDVWCMMYDVWCMMHFLVMEGKLFQRLPSPHLG